MKKQEYSLLSDIRKYRDTDKKTNEENFFTEILNWYLNQVDFVKKNFIETIDCLDFTGTYFETQRYLSESSGFMDIFAETETSVLIIENKIYAPATLRQLQHYVSAIEEADELAGKNRIIRICLFTRNNKPGFLTSDLKFVNKHSRALFMSWQELYDGIVKQLEPNQKLSPLWRLLDAYFVGEGLLRRLPLNQQSLSSLTFLRGQCITMSEDFISHPELMSRFEHLALVTKADPFDVNQEIEYRWGRVGINLRQADSQTSSQWWPNVFAGVMIDNASHKLKNFNGPKIVIIVEWSNLINRRSSRKNVLNSDLYQDVKAFKQKYDNQDQVSIEIHEELANKWRFLVIETNLNRYIDQPSLDQQDQPIMSFYLHWLDLLVNELHIERMASF